MEFAKTEQKYVSVAIELAKKELKKEQDKCDSLRGEDYGNYLSGLVTNLFNGNYGLVAIDHGEMVGYLAFYGGIKEHFGNARGSFSPLFGSAFGGTDRSKIVSLLFQKLSKIMTKDGISSFAICKYAHDEEIAKALLLNGFGVRCSDGIKDIRQVGWIQKEAYTYEEILKKEYKDLLGLKNSLQAHLSESPIYFPHSSLTESSFLELCEKRKSRFFVAKDGGKIIGYMEVDDSGETFISESNKMQNVCGMFLDTNYRGFGVAENLLNYVANTLKKEQYDFLSVDFETINPTALRFWNKHFESYTYSFIRRIDERIL